MKTPQNESMRVNITSLILSIASIIFVFGGSFLIYYFSKGYRIDFDGRELRKTGVISVQSDPSNANLYIGGNDLGRTPRSRTLDTGINTISVWKDGYREWKKDVEILEEKTTPVFPFLILEESPKTTLWESKNVIERYWINRFNSHFIFLTQNEEELYTLWSYRVNTPIWNLSPNPMEILTIKDSTFDLQISSNGLLGLLKTDEYYILELQRTNDIESLEPLDIPLDQNYSLTWGKDDKHIILENENQILSLDTSRNITHPLVQKDLEQKYIWTTDEEGFFYLVEPLHTQEDDTYKYAIKQIRPDGSNAKYTIETVYFQKDEQFAQYYRENGEVYPEFKNSPQSTQTTGQITSLEVNQSAKGVFIQTTTSAYWYNMDNQRYRMVYPHPAELIKFTPDSTLLLFANGESIHTFRFEKEEGDHTKKLGSKKVFGVRKDEIEELNWLSNSSYISYIEDSTLFISEMDGENKQDTIRTENILLHSIKNGRDYIVTLEKDDPITGSTTSINQYRIK
jgi:hypothetical protein